MRAKNYLKIIPTFLVLLITACASAGGGYSTLAATGIGAGVGAGTGALVGASISNGDILASAGLGAGLGAATVLASRYAIRKYEENKEIKNNNKVIKDNYETIRSNDDMLCEYARRVRNDSADLEPTAEQNRYFEGVVQ